MQSAVESWLWNPGCGILAMEALGDILEASRRHLGGIWEAREASRKHPEGIQEASARHLGGTWEAGVAMGAQGHLGAKNVPKPSCFLFKVARPLVSSREIEGDPHRLPHLCTKVGGRVA